MTVRHSAPDLTADTIHDARGLSLSETLQQMLESRSILQTLADQHHTRLVEMRDKVRADAMLAQSNLLEQLELTTTERDAARRQLECLKEEVRRLQVERDLAVDEASELREQIEQQQSHLAGIDRSLQTLKQEAARRDELLDAERDRCKKLEQENAEFLDLVQAVENVETEVRQQQETLRREREALSLERQHLKATPAGSQPIPSGPRLLSFACNLCGKPLQASELRAGLVMKCSHCGRIVPVPK